MVMTQDDRWQARYEEVKAFIEKNKRNPSKHDDAERGMFLNWVKHNRKVFNAGEMKEERREKFQRLLELMEEHRRKNQYDGRGLWETLELEF